MWRGGVDESLRQLEQTSATAVRDAETSRVSVRSELGGQVG